MIRTRVESMAYGGHGVARIDDFVHFIPGTAPGDLVEIIPVRRKRRYAFSRLLRILEPSPLRTDPFCPHFRECGGCRLQHIRYSHQLDIKKRIFLDQLRRIGHLENLPEPEEIGSQAGRIRMRLTLQNGRIGLLRERSHTLCPIRYCEIASPGVNQLLRKVGEVLEKLPDRPLLHGKVDLLSVSGQSHLAVDLSGNEAHALWRGLGETVRGVAVRNRGKRFILGNARIPIPVRGLTLYGAADLFLQANPEINEILIQKILGFLEKSGRVADLYCGCGNITLPLSRICEEAIGIEKNPVSIDCARRSASKSAIPNVSFTCGNAAAFDLAGMDGVVVDPPRSGLSSKMIANLIQAAPGRIAYVSCNPSTLARDLGLLTREVYAVRSLFLLDMFPHTHHIESLALITRE